MPAEGNNLSRNPHVCASCSSLADGMEGSGVPENAGMASEMPEAVSPVLSGANTAELAVRHGSA